MISANVTKNHWPKKCPLLSNSNIYLNVSARVPDCFDRIFFWSARSRIAQLSKLILFVDVVFFFSFFGFSFFALRRAWTSARRERCIWRRRGETPRAVRERVHYYMYIAQGYEDRVGGFFENYPIPPAPPLAPPPPPSPPLPAALCPCVRS